MQGGYVSNWGDGLVTDPSVIAATGISDPNGFFMGARDRTKVDIRRANVASDGFDKLGNVNLKEPISITFIDKFGQPE